MSIREARMTVRASPPPQGRLAYKEASMNILNPKRPEPKDPLDALIDFIYSVGETLLDEGRAPTDAEISQYDALVAAHEGKPAFHPGKLDRQLEGRM